MFAKKSLSVFLCLLCYLVSSSTFSHVNSMNMPQIDGEAEMVMSDCGMMMKVSPDNIDVDSSCFEKCFGPYDDVSQVGLNIISNCKYYTHTRNLLDCSDLHWEDTVNNPSHAPPDERCLFTSSQTPYFSHKDTTKRE